MSEAAKLSPRRAEAAALFALAVQLAFAGLTFFVAVWCGSRAVLAEAAHLAVGVWLWFVVILHLRHRRRAEDEARELAELMRARQQKLPGTALFEQDEEELHLARTRLETFEKYFVPACSVVMVVALGALSVYLYRALFRIVIPQQVTSAPIAAAFVVGQALIAFLIAKYAAGMATQAAWRPLRGGASYMASCAVVLFVVGIGLALAHFRTPQADRILAYVVPGGMALLALEMLLNILLDLYRPRVEGQETRFAYDSRVLGLLVEPSSIVHTVAQTLDYQFGFKVSETWMYGFLEKAVAPLVLFQVLTFYLLTCFLIVAPEEQAFIERFGKPTSIKQPLGPGLHLKWPWPIEVARRFPARRVQELRIGEFDLGNGPQPKAILWTESHAKKVFKWMVASRSEVIRSQTTEQKTVPVSFITGMVTVYYEITNLYDYVYRHVDGQAVLKQIAHRELTRYMASVDIYDILTTGRRGALESLRHCIQDEADRVQLGVTILLVGLQDIHPPLEVAHAYQAVVGATEKKQTEMLAAEADRNRIVPQAESEAKVTTLTAEAYRFDKQVVTEQEAARFEKQLVLFNKAPNVFMWRRRLMALVEAIGGARKYIVPAWANVNEVDVIDLQEKLQLDILDAAAQTQETETQ